MTSIRDLAFWITENAWQHATGADRRPIRLAPRERKPPKARCKKTGRYLKRLAA